MNRIVNAIAIVMTLAIAQSCTQSLQDVHVATRFPQPGIYKLWGQFNRNGEMITADYWVEVQSAQGTEISS